MILERVQPAQKVHANAALIVQHIEQLYLTDAARVLKMRRTAGAAIHALDLDYAHAPLKRPLGAIIQHGQLRRRRKTDADPPVLGNGGIGLALDLKQLCAVEHTVKIYSDVVLAHVEADIMVAIFAVSYAGYYMLAAMVLHAAAPQVGINAAADLCPRAQLAPDGVADLVPLLAKRKHWQPAYAAAVRQLPAAAREKDGAVKRYLPAIGDPVAGCHAGLELKKLALRLIYFFSRHFLLSLSIPPQCAQARLIDNYHGAALRADYTVIAEPLERPRYHLARRADMLGQLLVRHGHAVRADAV